MLACLSQGHDLKAPEREREGGRDCTVNDVTIDAETSNQNPKQEVPLEVWSQSVGQKGRQIIATIACIL